MPVATTVARWMKETCLSVAVGLMYRLYTSKVTIELTATSSADVVLVTAR